MMQQEQIHETIVFYNTLLSAERAGVEVLSGLIQKIEDNDLNMVLKKFLRDEGMNCQIFSTLIKNTGEEPGKKTGNFVQKVDRLETMEDKIKLLIRGQDWVARYIRKNRALFIYGSPAMFMESIKIQHEENVDILKRFVGSP